MRGDDALGSMGGEALRPDELEMIDEAIGLDAVAEAARRGGMGEDLQRAHDQILTQPRGEFGAGRYKMKLPEMKPQPKPAPGGAFGQQANKKVIPIVRSIPYTPNEGLISNFYISNDKSYRVDSGLEGRTDILIANMSLSVVWVNMIANISSGVAYVGVPLKAMSGAAAYDGGVVRLAMQKNKRFWAISVGAGPNLIVTIETAIRE